MKDKRVDELIQKVIDIIERHISGQSYRLFLFGSRAKGISNSRSDIDLALEAKKMSVNEFRQIKREVNSIRTLYSIDLIDLNRVEKSFHDLIKKRMELIVERSG